MRRSTRFLPENKRQDLRQLVGLIREHIKDVGMIVLFGSYAKDKYVDYDQRIEFGVPTYYMSDYDILILTDKEIGAVRYSLFRKSRIVFRGQEPTVPYASAVHQLRYRRFQLRPFESPLLRDRDQTRRNHSLRFGKI
ncbi:MAG: hypothetical protein ACLR8Y_06945 [Alistipes indistinctus]